MTATTNGGSFGYDANGNMATRVLSPTTYTLVYDAENRLIQYKQGSTVLASYVYDGNGTLVQKVAGGATTYYAGAHYEKTVWSALSATPLNYGVACLDNATGTGYLMYSEESVYTRFAAHPPQASNATHFICVKYTNGWVYDNNSAYYAFTPELSDRLVAAVDYSSDTVTALVGVDGDDHGIVKGYASGDLSFTANQWGGAANPGEFGVSGTQFTPNALEAKSYFLDGQPVALRRGSTLFYLHADHLGSASLTTDASGAVVSEMRYYPYGETRSGTVPTDRRFTGQREETGLGLYDYVARRYDPALGRFIQADTLVPDAANPQSLNRYSYVLGNPLKYVDLSGHDPLDAAWEKEFESFHHRSATWQDRLVRLFSIAFPNEWNWSGFYTPDGSYIEGSLESHLAGSNRSQDRTWAGMPEATEQLAGWYATGETEAFVRDMGTLFAGLLDRFDEPSIHTAVTGCQSGYSCETPLPMLAHVWAYLSAEGLPEYLTGQVDRDANVHHWAWSLVLGYYAGSPLAISMNTWRETVQAGGIRQALGNSESTADIWLGNRAAVMGANVRLFGVSPRTVSRLWRLTVPFQ